MKNVFNDDKVAIIDIRIRSHTFGIHFCLLSFNGTICLAAFVLVGGEEARLPYAYAKLSMTIRALEDQRLAFGITCLIERDVAIALRASNSFHNRMTQASSSSPPIDLI